MQTNLHKRFHDMPSAGVIETILRKCVHCGFCNATCPTYQLRGDELDGPRGRIYQIKQLFEGAEASAELQLHLDRCLTCRSCETTCPSGVRYSRLLELGREAVDSELPRSVVERFKRWAITRLFNSGPIFNLVITCARAIAPLMPASLRASIPEKQSPIDKPDNRHDRKIIMLSGCVQPTLTPNTNAAAIKLLDHFGIQTIEIENRHCCGAVGLHTSQMEQGRAQARKLIDYWWSYIEDGAEAIVTTATGCGVTVKEYVELFEHESAYAERARKISKLACDLSEIIEQELDRKPVQTKPGKRVAVHTPCTMQHGLGLKGKVESILQQTGYQICEVADAHLCCGSAGTYSILQPQLSKQLRANKQVALAIDAPEVIVTSNIGCQLHIADGLNVPVVHWIELLYQGLERK
ncbi:MAG: glycolate oxidase subunit GlcF [Gammaproteobacteria bacterium]|nr:glycolate oxidase subunit GlcF [Gammaproteobacteria bacterium]